MARRRQRTQRRAGTSEGSQGRVVRNILANTGGTLVSVALGLFLTPFMIHRLGVEAYGVWILATTLTFGVGYFSWADLGIEQAAVRYIAEARAAGDDREMNRVWITSFVAFAGIALVLTPPLILLSGPLVDLFSVPESLKPEATTAFAFVLAQFAFELPARGFSALLEGAQRYGLWQVTRLLQGLLLSGATIAILIAGKGVGSLGMATFGAQAVTFVVTAVVALRGVAGARVSLRLVSRKTMRRLAGYAGQLLAFRFFSSIARPMDKAIIGIALSTAVVTTYEVANKLYMAAALVETLATSALVPTAAYNRDQPERLREMLLRGSNYTLAFALPFMTAGFIFAEPLIRTWIGAGQTDAATPARLLLLSLVPSFAIVVGQTMLVGLGRIRSMIWMVAGWTAVNLILSIILVGPMGINGPVVATLVSTVLLFFPVVWLFLREIGVTAEEWTKDVILPVLPGLALQVGVGLLLLPIAEDTGSLLLVAFLCAVSVLTALAGWVLIGLSKRRRGELVQMIRETAGIGTSEPLPEVDLAGDLPTAIDVPLQD